MKICGIKLTHDASVTLIDDGKLIFCHEVEKIENNNRYSEFKLPFQFLSDTLAMYGYSLDSLDSLVIDGWHGMTYEVKDQNQLIAFQLAEYGWLSRKHEDAFNFVKGEIPEKNLSYKSYKHFSGHIFSAYCTSPFAVLNESSFVLVWDGATFPRLFYYRPESNILEDIAILFPLIGTFYTYFANHFYPFNRKKLWELEDNEERAFVDLSIAGKVMAFIGLGEVDDELLTDFYNLFENQIKTLPWEVSTDLNYYKFRDLSFSEKYLHLTSQDILATIHTFINDLLVDSLAAVVSKLPDYSSNLCYAGGCALNIKWNNSIRAAGLFKNVWIPPFPNDSGSSIGVACTEMINETGNKVLDWSVYSGPPVVETEPLPEWECQHCDIKSLAKLLAEGNEPVVFLNGRAELGPRALGNRSILASPSSLSMKDLLNKVKDRESYRPVAPLCLEEDAPKVFDPGFPDPYMLFDHKVRSNWQKRIPAVLHVDSTARLQTINKSQNAIIFELLTEFKHLTGIPLLCNTSANFNGKGFFPDVSSVMKWAGVSYIWSDGKLYFSKARARSKKRKGATSMQEV